MSYGLKIKEIRKSLRASQADIANINISRNLISSIEKGHTNLTPQKGLLIYERLLEISLEKQNMIVLNLDDLLSNLPRYNHLKAAYEFCSNLYTNILDDCVLNLDELDKNLTKVNQYDIGLIKFFTYLFTARYYKKYNQKKSYDYYVASMEFLKWHYPLDKETLFSMTFYEATPIGYELEKYDTLSYFLDKNLQLKKDLNIAFNVNHYYNLALFYNSNNDFEKAIDIANTYISLAKEITTGDLVDALIIKAIGYSSLNEIRDSILLYEECIRMTENTEFITQYALCLSNALHCISYHELASHQHLIKPYETALLDVLKQEFSDPVSISNLYSNLGLSQTYLSNYDKAIYYFEKAFKIIEDKQTMSKEISLLEESFDAFHHKHMLEQYITYVLQVDYKSLEDRAKIQFMKVLLRLQQIMMDNKPLNTYINQILARQ